MEPLRMGVVKERDHRLEADLREVVDEVPVSLERAVVPRSRRGLDTAP